MHLRRTYWLALLLLISGCEGTGPAPERYPAKTVTLICPWAAGGGTDRCSRFWADALQAEFSEFGQSFIVVNRTGGSGAVGHSAGATARPDGYTITTITAELSTMHLMGISPLTYRDYECVLQYNADAAAVIVRKDAPWQSLGEFLAEVKASPGKIKMSGTAIGGTWDLARIGMLQAAGLPVNSLLWVPSEGSAPSLTDLLGGHIDAVCCSVPEADAQIKAGELRVLAVMSAERLAGYPELPTCREQGVDWVGVGWRGLAVPKGTSPVVVERLAAACEKMVELENFQSFMKKNGFGIEIRRPQEFATFLAEQEEQWKPVVEAAGYAK